jgi:ABC-2 type transport system permease protein
VDRLIALVLLRWKLEVRGLLRARARAVGLLLIVPWLVIFAGAASLVVFAGVRALGDDADGLRALLSVAVTGLGMMWALSPVLAGVAFTESHDLTRLLHFPLPLSTLVTSSVLANVTQPMVLAELPVAAALALALADRPAALPFTLLGTFSSVAFMLVAAQCAGLLLHGLSRNRRLQDVALFAGLGFGFLFSVLPLLLVSGAHWPLRSVLRTVLRGDLFAFSPFAWGVRAASHAGQGNFLAFAAWEAAQLLAVAGGLFAASLMVGRIYRGELSLGPARGRVAGPARMRFSGPLGAVLEKDLRSAWRDPATKAMLVMGVMWPLIFTFVLAQARSRGGGGATVLMLAALVGASTFGANAFGTERRGVGLLMSFPVERWRILVAKNLAALVLRLPGLLVVLGAALYLAPPLYVPAAVAVALSTMVIAAGADNYVSVLFPVAAPEAGKNPYGGGVAGGRGLGAALMGALLLALTLVAASPFVFLCWLPVLLDAPALWLLTLPLALGGAVAVYALMVAGAERLLLSREPELLESILTEA